MTERENGSDRGSWAEWRDIESRWLKVEEAGTTQPIEPLQGQVWPGKLIKCSRMERLARMRDIPASMPRRTVKARTVLWGTIHSLFLSLTLWLAYHKTTLNPPETHPFIQICCHIWSFNINLRTMIAIPYSVIILTSHCSVQARQHMPVIQAFRCIGQKDCEFSMRPNLKIPR